MAESAWYSWAAGVPVTILEIDQASTALAGQADMGTLTLASPTANPAAISATVLSESGNLNGAYQYVMTETVGAIDGHGNLHPAGQTAAGTASNVVNASDNPIALSVPAPSALAISRTLWRTTGGGSTFYFLVTIVDPQVSTWTDNVADADLGTTIAPTVNTTGTVLQLPVFPAVPAFAAPAGVIVAVTVASGTTVLYRSNGSGWLPVPDLAVANTWTANQTFSGGVTVPTTATFTNSGTYAGSPLLTSLTAGTGVSVTNPTSPGTATVNVSDAPNTALAGPLVTSLTATDGLSVSNPTGVGAASYSMVLNGATLSNGTSGLSVNLDNANTWTAVQTLDSPVLSGTTTNSGTISGGTVNPASGTVAGSWAMGGGARFWTTDSNGLVFFMGADSYSTYGDQISDVGLNVTQQDQSEGLPAPNSAYGGGLFRFDLRADNPSTLPGLGGSAQWYILLQPSGTAGEGTPYFGVDSNGAVASSHSTFDNGSGAATIGGLLTANGNLALPSTTPDTAAGVVSQSGNQLYIGNGSTAIGVLQAGGGIEVEIASLFDAGTGTPLTTATGEYTVEEILLDNVSGFISGYFEAMLYSSTGTTTAYAELQNLTASTTLATVSTTNTSETILRSGSFTLTTGTYSVYLANNGTGDDVYLLKGRIVGVM